MRNPFFPVHTMQPANIISTQDVSAMIVLRYLIKKKDHFGREFSEGSFSLLCIAQLGNSEILYARFACLLSICGICHPDIS
jgi:hypothetical protein